MTESHRKSGSFGSYCFHFAIRVLVHETRIESWHIGGMGRATLSMLSFGKTVIEEGTDIGKGTLRIMLEKRLFESLEPALAWETCQWMCPRLSCESWL